MFPQLDETKTPFDELCESFAEAVQSRRMIQYTLDAPDDATIIKTILFDALNGCNGAENVDEIRAKFGIYQSEQNNEQK